MLHPESQHQSVSGGPQEQPWRLCAAQNGVNIGAYLVTLSLTFIRIIVDFVIRIGSQVLFLRFYIQSL